MPWLPFYADDVDLRWIIDFLNQDYDVAFLRFDRPGVKRSRWKAVSQLTGLTEKRVCMWHVPSGPLPLLTENRDQIREVVDPWNGWEEERTGANSSTPYFGAGHVGIVWLNNRTNGKPNTIGLSSFEWIGNRYSIIGKKADESTEKWWKDLRKTISKNSEKIGREDTMKPEIFCLRGAKEKIGNGYSREANPI